MLGNAATTENRDMDVRIANHDDIKSVLPFLPLS
jgi:hypothetical protein